MVWLVRARVGYGNRAPRDTKKYKAARCDWNHGCRLLSNKTKIENQLLQIARTAMRLISSLDFVLFFRH
jgi:hypothetical protein